MLSLAGHKLPNMHSAFWEQLKKDAGAQENNTGPEKHMAVTGRKFIFEEQKARIMFVQLCRSLEMFHFYLVK